MDDAQFMQRALELAGNALYDTDPNPAVGCTIVADGQVIGEGWTQPAGGPHAEIVALDAAGARAAGATAYVTLEPCCHQGRTGPCTQALIAAGITRVVYAIDDPNPQVSGHGAQILREADIEVSCGPGADQARQLNAGFISRMSRGRPFVRVKIAASIDGRTALSNGISQWITGEQARADVHRWRARSSAVLTGIGTVRADDPRMSARPTEFDHNYLQPLRVVLDSALQLAPQARLLEDGSPVLVLTCAEPAGTDALPEQVEIRRVHADATGRCDLNAVLAQLAADEINDVWVEGGRTLSGSLLQAGLVDELIIYTAPVVLGDDAMGMFALGGLTAMSQRLEFSVVEAGVIGGDLRVILRPSTVSGPFALKS